MISRLKHGRFFNHLLGSNLILLIIISFYNLLTYFIPLSQISITQIIFFFLIIDLLLIIFKILALHN
ncbi:hypothetical protein BBP12_07820 [Limosilactobacillus reuteri]|uniref:Uncharacterized protein n=1 Tax=Limosilactobacillus reuteri TaxID=1598 RepID=A0A1C1ZQT0_LIMRT|nr:hypothetical protein BBP12_07820 [Limosilactobacillus reuteri]OCW65451.1 hypothetical protein BBP11_05230 [Limosilactobacillus reuteri]OCW66014.1 hypothetical protein BBP10_02985 [Limosilactobacillus reuteri]OCW68097.1 hypothetical protein BBP13_08545 [Limosilactobacillus reuteri]OCW69625.1 hypothetical protein BBP14_03520 [Limosilactobacillus reuteri]